MTMSQQPGGSTRGGRGRGRAWQGQAPGRGVRGSTPSTRGSPAPSGGGTDSGRFSGTTGGGRPPRGGGSVPSHGGQSGTSGGGSSRGRGGFRGGSPAGGPAAVFAEGRPLTQDPRLADSELNGLVQSFKSVKLQPDMPLRPGWGTLGEPGVVRTNFFAVRLKKDAVYYEYEIAISPNAQAKGNMRFRIMQLVEQADAFRPYIAHVAHDRSQRLVSVSKLPQPLEIPIRYLEEDQADDPKAPTFTVEIKFLSELRMSKLDKHISGKPEHRNADTQPLVSALNLILQQYAQRHGVRVGRNKYFFPASSEHHPLSLGVEAFRGFFMSVRPMYKQLMVNINLCMTAFYVPGNLAWVMIDFQRQTHGGMPDEFAEKLKVSTRHLGYTRLYTIRRIVTEKSARQAKFYCEEFRGEITVEKFFKRKHNIDLRHHSDLPVIDVSNPRSDKPTYLPVEICEIIPGQAYHGKLDPKQTAAMIKVACNPPAFNGDVIVNQGFTDLGLRPNAPGATLAAFGISVDHEMQVVPYRRLPPPSISYRSGKGPQVRDAGWNILDVKLHVGGDMTNWAVLLVQEGRDYEFGGSADPALTAFLDAFRAKCRNIGISGADKRPKIMSVSLPLPSRDTRNRSQAIRAIRDVLEQNLDLRQRSTKPSFVLVLLSAVDKYIYPGIKQLADVELGIHTVHMLLNKARDQRPNKQDQYFSNVVLKVNTKLGGVNHQLDENSMRWLKAPGGRATKTMVMGIDVTHPSPLSLPGTPSIVAVVASIDDRFAQFPASLALQKPDWNKDSKEMVESLTQLTIERLQLYKKRNAGKLPERILVFRDGVSEGQYEQVLRHELPRLQAAFKQISPTVPYKPKLSIIVCGKRHHARFWPPDSAHATKNGNTRPGTVVDKGITDVYDFDFYLQAHNGLQGHVKATHYVVVYDENKLDADTIQQGTHTVSYLYARATKAVSLVPAAYYADIACERGREYLNVLMNVNEPRSSAAGPRSAVDRQAQKEAMFERAKQMWGAGVHADLKDTMFYI
ncbi:Piwi-domain-containing protein [Dichomitus squalens]|uniref:Piwi-domain-containing protein n=1 Tax=Dichomitus squalens TaxID=114155 RepID=A0A4Q9NBW2_9APHY|nr:Piwi-domain-containing protein [Dichomitus squalens]TBU60286.1 Piwi-domain-containing protein [Dichomitus squalens]